MIPLRDNNPTRNVPHVTYLLIAANIFVYVYEVILGSMQQTYEFRLFVASYGAIPSEIVRVLFHPGQWFGSGQPPIDWFGWPMGTLFTSMFLHGGLLHLAGNMLFLYIFGDNIEDTIGSWQFLVFYLVCGLTASITHVTIEAVPALLGLGSVANVPMVGASGAIGGVMGAYILFFPGARVLTMIFFFIITFIEIPAYWFLGIWFVMQFFGGLTSFGAGRGVGGTAFWAHVGGFIMGLLIARWWLRWKGYDHRIIFWR